MLIPGIGSQGGRIEELVTVLEDHKGLSLISSSRSILFAGGNNHNWEKAVEKQVKTYREELSIITERHV
ncbi:MAG: hypothetical protein U5K69_05180 [Balneolaceae bacterium]|nr:hypothetical protein [Balneolaceae bacterium]